MSFASQFALGQRIAGDLIDTYTEAKKKREIGEVADAKPDQINQGFTTEDADQLDAAAKSGMYDISAATNPDGSFSGYSVSPKSEPGNAGVIATKGVTDFLGKRTAGTLSDDQVDAMRTRAMADVIAKYDPEKGMMLRRQAKQDARDDVRFSREEKKYAREDGLQAIQDQAGQEFQNSLVNPDGSRREATPADFVAQGQRLAYSMANAGYTQEAQQQMANANAGMLAQLQVETAQRKQAGNLAFQAAQAGDFKPLMEYYNKFVPSGMKVSDASVDDKGNITLSGVGMDGKPVAPQTLGNIERLGYFIKSAEDPTALYQYSASEFTKNLQLKADKRADQQLALSEAASARAGRSEASQAQLRGLQLEKAKMELEEAKATAKVPPQVRDQIKGKQELLKNISNTINNAMAKGEFAQDSPQAATLVAQQAKLQKEIDDLYSPYLPEGVKGTSDPGFIDPPNKTPKPAGTQDSAQKPKASSAPQSVAAQRGAALPQKTPPMRREEAVAKAFGATGKGDTLDQQAQEKALAVLALQTQQAAEQARMVEIAQGGDRQAIAAQSQRVMAVGAQIKQMLSGINDQQQAAIRRAMNQ